MTKLNVFIVESGGPLSILCFSWSVMVNVKVFVLSQKILILVDYGKCKVFVLLANKLQQMLFLKRIECPRILTVLL